MIDSELRHPCWCLRHGASRRPPSHISPLICEADAPSKRLGSSCLVSDIPTGTSIRNQSSSATVAGFVKMSAVSELRDYKRKRDKAKTPEPFDSSAKGVASEPTFVVQRHDSRRLHYDLRLEMAGALASWAVPKGIPLEPGSQHLAVHVEDHPLEYADFEGEIPAGEYGAGKVEIWDRGSYELLEQKPDGGLTFRLNGARLDGVWALVPARLSGDEKNWLLLKKRDDGDAQSPRDSGKPYAPMLASLSDGLPGSAGWIFEFKWDGYRAIAIAESGSVRLLSRNGNDFTDRFPSVGREIVRAVKTPRAVLDGEVVAFDEEGKASFGAMQRGAAAYAFFAFDLLEVEGKPVVDKPLEERRRKLQELLDDENRVVHFSESFEDGPAVLQAAQEQGLEGVVAKRLGSRYLPGKRSGDWRKLKTVERQEFVIAGYTFGRGRRQKTLGALVLSVSRRGELEWVGNVGTGFDEDEIERLVHKLRPLERKTTPLANVPKMPRVRAADVTWVTPKLVCEVKFSEWTREGHLRAPVYLGLREEKAPVEVRRERPLESVIQQGSRQLRLSNLDKPFWPEQGVTKGDLITYYRDVAEFVVPHLEDRPFTMKRYPDGWQGKHFFQKDAPKHMPDWIASWSYHTTSRRAKEHRTIVSPLVNDEMALLWVVNMGTIDMNAWLSRIDRPDRPDFVLFDLDPSEDVSFATTVEVTLLVKETLDVLGLRSFPKTSGSDGIHILVPTARRYRYEQTLELVAGVAGLLSRRHPDLVTTEFLKEKRRGVLIDAHQNGQGRTIAFVYSVRPKEGAPVSTPLRWEELTPELRPSDFTMDVVLDRLERHGDLYAPTLTDKQAIGPALSALRKVLKEEES